MNNLSLIFKSLSVSLAIIIFANSIGYAKESTISKPTPDCGEWRIEGGNLVKDQRIAITPQSVVESDCYGLFALSNHTDVHIGGISLGGGYTLKLETTSSDAKTQFLLSNQPFPSFLFPGLEIDIKTIPNNNSNQATVNLQGNLSRSAFAFDLAFFLTKFGLAFVNLPCVIPTEQIFLASNRAVPILDNTVKLAFDGNLVGSYKELSKVIDPFYEKSGEAFRDIGVECSIESLGSKLLSAKAKILLAYLTWLPVVIFDYLQYEGAPASFTFVYSPPAPATPSSEGWIAFLNQNNVWLIHPDGSGLKQVTSNPISANNHIKMKWSPDGQNLALTQGGPLYLLDISTFTTTLLIENIEGGFDWSPTGEEIIYSTPSTSDLWSDSGLWAINLEDGKIRQIVPPSSSNRGFWNPEWSPDGSHVIFVIPAWEPSGISVVDLVGGESARLPLNIMGGIGMGGCEWAPSDVIIACATKTDEGPYKSELRLLNADGTLMQKILLPDKVGLGNILWSPDGKKLAMGHYSNKRAFTSIFSFSNEDVQSLASGFPTDWSPDGKWIVSWESGLDENWVGLPRTIHVVNVNSGETFPIAEGTTAIWQPSGGAK